MHQVTLDDLPFRGMAHQFIGADHGDTGISAYLLRAKPGQGPVLHRHPYDEIHFISAGRARYTVDGRELEAGAGEILVIKAGEVHGFRAVGDEDFVQIGVHLSPRFIQENLPDGEIGGRTSRGAPPVGRSAGA